MADISSSAIIPTMTEEEEEQFDFLRPDGGLNLEQATDLVPDATPVDPLDENFDFLEPAVTDNSRRGVDFDPDQFAKDADLGRYFEMPYESISDENRFDFLNQRKVEEIQDTAIDNPVTGYFLGERPELSILAQDDLGSLSRSERAAREMGFFGAFSKGVDILQGLGYRTLEAGAEAIGAESLEDFAERKAELQFLDARIQGETLRITDVQSAEDLYIWMKQTAGEGIPLMAPVLAGGATGAAIGSTIPVLGTAVGATIGSIVGAFIPGYILGVGEVQQSIKERDPNIEAPGVAFGAGALIAAVDSLLPGRVGSQMSKAFGRELAEEAINKIAFRTEMFKNGVEQAGVGMSIEGVTEVIQETIAEYAAAEATDTEVGDLTDQLINAFAVGAFMGGSIGVSTSVGGDLMRARRQKQAMDAMHLEEGKSKLRQRDAALNAALKVDQLKSGGVSEVYLPADAILQWAQQHEQGPQVALSNIGVMGDLEQAVTAGDKVRISSDAFIRNILGTDSYVALANKISFSPDRLSLEEAAAQVFANEETEANLVTELEKYDASPELKDQVKETLGKVKGGAAKAIEEASPAVRAVLDDLIARNTETQEQISEDVRTGRVAQLDQELSLADSEISRIYTELEKAESEGKGTKRIQARLDRAVAKRDKLVEEQTDLGFEQITVGISQEAQQEFEAGETAKRSKKPIKTKANTLLKLGVKISRDSVRNVRKAFKAALKEERSFAKKKEALIRELRGLEGFKTLSAAKQKSLEAIIRRARDEEKLPTALDAVRSKAVQAIEKARIKQIKKAIKKLLKDNKTKRSQQRKKGTIGRMTPEISDFIDSMPLLLNMDEETAQAALATATENPHSDGSKTPNPGLNAVRNLVLDLAARPDQVNIIQVENLLLSLQQIVQEGKSINRNNAFNRAARHHEMRQEALDIINPIVNVEEVFDDEGNQVFDDFGPVLTIERQDQTGGKIVKAFAKIEGALLGQNGAWYNKLYRIARSRDKKKVDAWVESLSLFDQAREMHVGVLQMNELFTTKMMKRLNLSQRQVLKYMQNASSEKVVVGKFRHADDRIREIEMSRAELIHLVGQLQNESVRERSMHKKGDAYTEEIIEALKLALSENDNRAVLVMTEFYNEYYPRINKAYSAAEGINLVKEEDYFPTSREGDPEDISFLGQVLFGGNVSSGALKSRTGSVKPLKRRNGFGTLMSHINEMEYYIAYREKVSDINAVFNGDTLNEIETIFDKQTADILRKDRDYFAQKGQLQSLAGEKFYVQLMRNFTISQLGLSGVITAKQFMSAPAFAEKVNTKDFILGIGSMIRNPKKAWDIMNESQNFNLRGQNIDADFVDVSADQFGGRVLNILGRNPNFTKFLTFNIRFGDKGAILLGGYAHYYAKKKELKKAGATEKEAHKKALRSMDLVAVRTQQSADPDQKSELQRSNAFGRIMSQFMSSANALTRAEYAAIVERARGRTTNTQLAKSILIYHFIIPNMIQLATNMFQWDDEDQIRASLLGSFNGLFIIGDVIEAIAGYLSDDEQVFDPENRHPLGVFASFAKSVSKMDDVSLEDFIEGSKELENLAKATGGISGIPLGKLYNMTRGVTESIDGNIPEGLPLLLGYSQWAIDKNL